MIRFIRASWLFFRILWSYLWLWARVKMRGRKAMKHVFPAVHRRNARRLYKGFLGLRGVYIKIGQVLSVLGSFLPGEYIEELEGLQDAVPPQPYRRIRRAIIKELGKPPEVLFKRFSTIPIAAASLGQVHEAELESGERVAVKVLYPNIDRIIRIDMRVTRIVTKVYSKLVPMVKNHENILDQVEDVLSRETNYLLEASNLERLAANFEGHDNILFPTVHHDRSSRGVLVLSFMDGHKISAVDKMDEQQIDRTEVARMLVKSYYKQMLVDGVFHADPHPGNFLVQPGPKIVFLDFGAVEAVRPELMEGMISFLTGMMTKNDDLAIEGIEKMGFVAPDGNRELLEQTVRHYFKRLVTMKISDYSKLDVTQFVSREEMAQMRRQMRELTKAIQYPKGYFYIERSMLLLFGVCALLDPKVNALELGFPFAMEFILKQNQRKTETASADTASVQDLA